MQEYFIREAITEDREAIGRIIMEVAQQGETFAMEAPANPRAAAADWFSGPPGRTIVAVDAAGVIHATASMYPNRPAQGAHIASGSLMVASASRGKGLGRLLIRDMIAWAVQEGYRAIQFNAVVETNAAAMRLYESEGFEVLATAPGAFLHPTRGFVGLAILWRDLRHPRPPTDSSDA